MNRWMQRHWPNVLLVVLAVWLCYLGLFMPSRCRADEDLGPAPVSARCPVPARCQLADGIWFSTAYAKKLAGDIVRLEGCEKERALFAGEIASTRRALEAAALRATVLTDQLAIKQRIVTQLEEAEWRRDEKLERRTRWAIAATVLGVVLAGALGAGIYVAGH